MPHEKVVYIAPMKALARQRVREWTTKFAGVRGRLGGSHNIIKHSKVVVELTGDVAPNIQLLRKSNIIITTPEKWDGVSRGWTQRTRSYVREVIDTHTHTIHTHSHACTHTHTHTHTHAYKQTHTQHVNIVNDALFCYLIILTHTHTHTHTHTYTHTQVGLVIIDEIHLLGADRGPILEVIVSRMRYISARTHTSVRVVGLSTALSNANDLADWLGVNRMGLFNFRPEVRPVPLEIHVAGFPGRHYCPRMATMNKPCYAAITTYSPHKPVLVFVSSRRQTRLTGIDLISFCVQDNNSHKFLHMTAPELKRAMASVHDPHLKQMLGFGIGMHHAGLTQRDRNVVEELYVHRKIQVLVCTSTLAWGVNFPAHLVVIKGTEYYDPKQHRYVDFPITDVLQMMGRAGRPQYDDEGVAVILVHQPKKNFYMKFLHEPFPVESSLKATDVLLAHFNAECVGGTIRSVQVCDVCMCVFVCLCVCVCVLVCLRLCVFVFAL